MEIPHILLLMITVFFWALFISGIIRKRGWNNYLQGLSRYYSENNRNVFSAYVYMFKTAIWKNEVN